MHVFGCDSFSTNSNQLGNHKIKLNKINRPKLNKISQSGVLTLQTVNSNRSKLNKISQSNLILQEKRDKISQSSLTLKTTKRKTRHFLPL